MSKSLYFIQFLVVVSILAILAYLLYTSMNKQEHFSLQDNVFHPVTDEAPSMCNTDSQCETKKCTTNGYCAI